MLVILIVLHIIMVLLVVSFVHGVWMVSGGGFLLLYFMFLEFGLAFFLVVVVILYITFILSMCSWLVLMIVYG